MQQYEETGRERGVFPARHTSRTVACFTVCTYELNEPRRKSPLGVLSEKRPKVAHHSGNLSLDDSSLLPPPSTDGRNFAELMSAV